MSKPLLMLDPGHGGYDPGAVANGLQEKDLNLRLALLVANRTGGARVLLTRERDVFLTLAERVEMSRRAGPDLFLSLHANAGGGRGFESFISTGLEPGDRAVLMQKQIHQAVIAGLDSWSIVDRGPKRAAFYVLRHNPHPAVLIESLFIDNAREASLWQNERFVEDLAGAVAAGAAKALGLPASMKERDAGRPPPGTSLYTVQVGAFAYIDNARQRLREAREAGFSDAYIYRKVF